MDDRDLFAGMIILVQFAQKQAPTQTATTYAAQLPVKMKTARWESLSGLLFHSRPYSLCCIPSKSASKPDEELSKNRANSRAKRRDSGRFLAMKLDTGKVNTDLTGLTARHSPYTTLVKSEHMRAPVLALYGKG